MSQVTVRTRRPNANNVACSRARSSTEMLVVFLDGEVPAEIRDKIVEIANKCPVHRTLEASSKVKTLFDAS